MASLTSPVYTHGRKSHKLYLAKGLGFSVQLNNTDNAQSEGYCNGIVYKKSR